MKKTIKRIIVISGLCLIAIMAISTLALSGLYMFSPKVDFDINKITNSSCYVNLFDNNKCILKESQNSHTFVKINTFPDYVTKCFISTEDKRFYNHNGLDYKRIGGAMIKNIKSAKIVQGASTISQQLIKNTHLTNQRTFSRKINEMILTKELEKVLTKDQILEYYLNIIYFGDNCYGIESASNHYFSKHARELTLNESAILAGLIKSPTKYSPTNNPDNCKTRRNIVLKEMYEDNNIDFTEYNKNCIKPIELDITKQTVNTINSYSQAVIDEACDILKMPAKQIAIGGYKIYTYYSPTKQKALLESAENSNIPYSCSAISVQNGTGNVEAYYAKSNLKLLNVKRQPGSAIKPILVYAPALNENIISPLTQINDEKININGFSPNNVNGKFSGYVSARDSLAKSLNIPAVKVLSYVGIDKAKQYAEKAGITFSPEDNNYALALGGFTDGVSLKDLVQSYTCIANKGKFNNCKFISYILDKNDKIIYHNKNEQKTVLREDTSYLLTDMLKTSVKKGTAKKLNDLNYEIASKTGTVGKISNTDAWNVSYTSNDIVGVWIGNVDNSPIENIVGGGKPTDIVKSYFSNIYLKNQPKPFEIPSSIQKEKIDSLSLNNEHVVYRANNYIPEKYIVEEVFSKFNLPKDKSTNFIGVDNVILNGKIDNNKAVLNFKAQDYLIYEIFKNENGKEKLVSVISGQSGEISQSFPILENTKTQYYVITKIKNFATNSEISSDKSNIIELYSSKGTTMNNIQTKEKSKWYV